MKTNTNHESFKLKPSTVSDIGVFMLHDVKEGTYLELFRDDFEEEVREIKDVPFELEGYCLGREDGKILCPKYFNRLDIGNYVNHSKDAKMRYDKGKWYFARRDIKVGEELFANYDELEPVSSRDEYN